MGSCGGPEVIVMHAWSTGAAGVENGAPELRMSGMEHRSCGCPEWSTGAAGVRNGAPELRVSGMVTIRAALIGGQVGCWELWLVATPWFWRACTGLASPGGRPM